MNIQIFGKTKCFETKKAERYFKERGINYQFVDLIKYGMSDGEFNNIRRAIGSFVPLVDENSKEYEKCFMKYLSDDEAKIEKLLENQGMFRTPIVRNGKQATIGYHPEIWKTWE